MNIYIYINFLVGHPKGVLGSLTVQSYERSSTRLAHAGRKANFPFATTTTSAKSIRNVSTTASNSDPLKKQLSPKPRARRRRRSSAAISRRHTAHKGVRPDVLAPSDDNTETIAEFQLAREDLETSIAKSRNAMERYLLFISLDRMTEYFTIFNDNINYDLFYIIKVLRFSPG